MHILLCATPRGLRDQKKHLFARFFYPLIHTQFNVIILTHESRSKEGIYHPPSRRPYCFFHFAVGDARAPLPCAAIRQSPHDLPDAVCIPLCRVDHRVFSCRTLLSTYTAFSHTSLSHHSLHPSTER